MDNSASLFSLVKGASNNCILDRTVAAFHLVCFFYQITVWFEYVDSKSNFSDGVSRELGQDTWCLNRGVRPYEFQAEAWFWISDWDTV